MSYELIETIELTSSASSIEFTSIPQDGADLLCVVSGRSDRASGGVGLLLNINNNTSGVYDYIRLQGNGSSVFSDSIVNNTFVYINALPNDDETANTFSSNALYFSNYTSSTIKSVSYDSVIENNATASFQELGAIGIDDTNGITSIKLTPSSSTNFVQYSTASLYKVTA